MERELEPWKTEDFARLLALVETERRYYQEVVAAVPVGLLILSHDLTIVSSNREVRAIFGNRPGEPMTGIVDQFLPAAVLAKARETIETGEPVNSLFMNIPGPPEKHLRVSIRQIRHWEDPHPEALLTIEEAPPLAIPVEPRPGAWPNGLPAGDLLDGLDGIVWVLELPSKRFLYVNEKAQELLGYPAEKWLNTPTYWADRIDPADRSWVLQAYEKSIGSWARHTCEYRAISSYGKVVWLRESVRLLQEPAGRNQHLIGFAIDVTQRHIFENEFVQAQRMNAVNRMAARVASEIVNHVMVISGFSEEMAGSLEESNPLQSDLREVMAASGKLRALASQLSSFHRHQALGSEPYDIVEFLKLIEPEVRRRAGALPVEITLFPAPMGIAVDPGQLQEVVLTLVDRARLALGPNPEGGVKLTVDCSPQEIEDVQMHAEFVSRAGVYATIAVEDNGPTLDSESRAALFESLLPALRSTRDRSQDLGPALSRAYSLVRQWGGDILVSPVSPQGNAVQVFLPRISTPIAIPPHSVDESEGRASTPAPADVFSGPRPQTILLIEEDQSIRTLLNKMLSRQSYNVLEATDLPAAQAICKLHAGAVDLLIADAQTAESLVGDELASLLESGPKLRILELAGEDDAVSLQARHPHAAVLLKPFTLGSLIAKVKESLAI
jgi:PAS domain S-box-containing protein